MAKKTKIAGTPALDSTLPDVSLELNGETFHLAFDYAALSLAERTLAQAGIKVNMLEALDLREIGAERLPILFFASLLKAQPEVTFEQTSALVTMRTYPIIFERVVEAYLESMSDPNKKNEAEDKKQENPPVEPTA